MKKGQLKIQQMVFMLIAITIFFVLVLLFYFAMQMSGMKQDAAELKRDKAAGLATRIASAPEFIFKDNPNSVDADKIMVLKGQNDYKNYWEDIGGFNIMTIAPRKMNVECTLTNYPNCNKITIFSNKGIASSSYVALCRVENLNGESQDICDLAILSVYVEDETN